MAEKIYSETKPFIISRTFDATGDLMWKMWTDPEHMKKWWGPKGTTIKYSKIDLRPGGTNHYCMISPDGQEMWGKQVYREITKPKRLVFENSFSNELGELTRHPLSPTWPLEMLTTITFMENNGKTTVTVEWIPMSANAEEIKTFDSGRGSMTQGWSGSFDVLEAYLSEMKKKKAHANLSHEL
ncbi:MAG: SRPBCC family protein [Bacteriovorax sp.]